MTFLFQAFLLGSGLVLLWLALTGKCYGGGR